MVLEWLVVGLALVVALLVLTYVLMQCNMLPSCVMPSLTVFFFYPCMVPHYLVRSLGSAVGRQNHWDQLAPNLLIGAFPLALAGQPEALYHQHGVRGVLNLMYEYSGPLEQYAALGIEQLHLPVVDHAEPSLAQLHESVKFITRHVAEGHAVYVHCKGGHGRSAAACICYLVAEGTDPEEAQRHMLSIRTVRKRLLTQPNVSAFVDQVTQGSTHAQQEGTHMQQLKEGSETDTLLR